MTLTVEDGTGKADAESYVSVADAKVLLEKRGITAFSDLDADVQEAALRNATEYMMAMYRQSWKGMRVKQAQALDWPRSGVVHEDAYETYTGLLSYPQYTVADNVVPNEVKTACALLANIASTTDLMPTLERAVLSESVGPLSVTYDRSSRESPTYPIPHQLLGPYLKNGGSTHMMRLQRT